MNTEFLEKHYYMVEPEGKGCRHCGLGEMWDVIGPDGIALGTSFGDRLSAEEYAEDLDAAYRLGLVRNS